MATDNPNPSALGHCNLQDLPFQTVLVANRGEIAVRLIQGAQALGLRAATVYTAADSTAAHVSLADVAVSLGSAWDAYIDVSALVNAAVSVGAGAVCPGYGFVSENPDAARAFESAGVRWIGPTPDTIDLFGLKHKARTAAEQAGVPTVPGSSLINSPEAAVQYANAIGFPVLIKASAGGGGMGQAIAYSADAVPRAYHSVLEQGESLFKNSEVYVERYIERARHIEVQVFGDGKGNVVALGERDCSVQRRRQKVIEEGPATDLDESIRKALRSAAINLCEIHNYRSAGTVEFILDADSKEWYFLEVNTRLQVEHGVTELVSGIDIVRWMILLAAGVDVLQNGQVHWSERGSALEVRVYAENPAKDYAPCPGQLSAMVWPKVNMNRASGHVVRVDAWAKRGTTISPYYDSLLGKILTWGRTRDIAIDAMKSALDATFVSGVPSNLELLRQTLRDPQFASGQYTTSIFSTFAVNSTNVEVITPGLQTSLQDYPGRVGYWNVGVSPSGAMDAYSMNLANALVGNPVDACAMEITVVGPNLKFHAPAIVALTGSRLEAELDDGKHVNWWTPFRVEAGCVLRLGGAADKDTDCNDPAAKGGKFSYLAVRGGFDAPKYLGSASTFPTGTFGGVHGGFLKAGDFIPMVPGAADSLGIATLSARSLQLSSGWPLNEMIPTWLIPELGNDEFVVGAINGPHGSEDFLHADSLSDIWTAPYTVHHAANRLGVRLIGPTPKWTRSDGGSAGLHPSNLHDYTYALGAVNFSGNTPIVLMVDGPSLGGFVCPITIASCELWKIAQARPGTVVRFKQVAYDDARQSLSQMREAWDAVRDNDNAYLHVLSGHWSPGWASDCQDVAEPAITASLDPDSGDKAEIKVIYRMSGDEHVLIEYGDIELDLAYRMRVHMLMEELKPMSFIRELCPGVRSLLVRYDPDQIHIRTLLESLKQLEVGVLKAVSDVEVPSRLIRLPLAFDDKWTREAQHRYLRSVRPDAPYMPSNVEFIRRINGLRSIDDVKKVLMSAEYCVMGLGDVYLGAPCAVPLDPRHRLVTSKYNPARTFTPEGAVGIGGSYMCIYGMDSPGGYQLCGRTLPIWDNFGSVPEDRRGSPADVPWLLRFFDRISFYPVTDDELEELRAKYRRGDMTLDISNDTLTFKEYLKFLETHKESISEFKQAQENAFNQERARWEVTGEGESNAAAIHASSKDVTFASEKNIDDDHKQGGKEEHVSFLPVLAGVASTVWSVEVAEGQVVEQGQTIMTLETMKVEISVEAPLAGTIKRIQVSKGDQIPADKELCAVEFSQDQALHDLSLEHLRDMYKLGVLDPERVMSSILKAAERTESVFICKAPYTEHLSRIEELKRDRRKKYMPLFGVPFVVSDNFDVAGMPTTHGCSSYRHVPEVTSPLVQALQDAGALLLGKTNIDQFGGGLTGTQSSFGIPHNPSSPGTICGASSGAAVAIASHLASFAVCIDTGGGGLLSSSHVGSVGLKVTEGLLSLAGVSPSSPSLDCVAIIASTSTDIETVLRVCTSAREVRDSSVRPFPAARLALLPGRSKCNYFTLGVPAPQYLTFEGCLATHVESSFFKAVQRLQKLGATTREIDFSPFRHSASIFDSAILDASRHRVHAEFVRRQECKNAVLPSVANAILRAEDISAACLAAGLDDLRRNQRTAEREIWPYIKAFVVPSSAAVYSVKEALQDPEKANVILGTYMRYITPMDLCAITLSARVDPGATFCPGVTLVAPAFHEADLLDIATLWAKSD